MSGHLCIDLGTAFSKAVEARADAETAVDPASLNILNIGEIAGEVSPVMVSSALFIGDDRLHFGARAVRACEARLDQGREGLFAFKSIVGAPDLAHAIEARPAKQVDPSGAFRRRDLIVLYLAWLVRLAEAAGGDIRTRGLRYTRPDWPTAEGDPDALVARLFEEAVAVIDRVGDALTAPEGLACDVALAAVAAARTAQPMRPIVEGAAFEAVAAASCHALMSAGVRRVLVFDIGAGTTDFAALRIDQGRLSEIPAARRTIAIGGDFLDQTLLDVAIQKARGLKTVSEKARAWRGALKVRECKEQVFSEGRGVMLIDGKPMIVKLSEISGQRDFSQAKKTLQRALADALDALSADVKGERNPVVHVVLAGGGANLKFVQEMVRGAKAKGAKVEALPIAPAWTHDARFGGNLAPIFPQLSIAIGAAVAPAALLIRQPIAATT